MMIPVPVTMRSQRERKRCNCLLPKCLLMMNFWWHFLSSKFWLPHIFRINLIKISAVWKLVNKWWHPKQSASLANGCFFQVIQWKLVKSTHSLVWSHFECIQHIVSKSACTKRILGRMWKAYTNHLYWGKILLWQEHPTKMVPTVLAPPPMALIKLLFPYLNLPRIFCHQVTGSSGMNFQILWHQMFPTGPTLCFGHNTQTRLSVLSLKLNQPNSSIDTQ